VSINMQDKRSGLLGVMARGGVLIQQGGVHPLGGVNKSLTLQDTRQSSVL